MERAITFPKSPGQKKEIVSLLRSNVLTKNLKESEIQHLVRALEPQSFKKGDIIIKYGEIGIFYYILAKGKAKVTVYKSETDPADPDLENKVQFQKPLQHGQGFGELALLYNDKRSATI